LPLPEEEIILEIIVPSIKNIKHNLPIIRRIVWLRCNIILRDLWLLIRYQAVWNKDIQEYQKIKRR
jgi:hypothetical protein